ncbi:hypothetical protein JCM17961_31990 [Endothiovibrio diazotrophicus]
MARETDRRLLELLRRGNHCNLHAGRQAGKTSLMMRARDLLRGEGHWCLEAEFSVLFNEGSMEEGLLRLARHLCAQAKRNTDGSLKFSGIRRARDDSAGRMLARLLERLADAVPEGGRLYLMWDELDILMRFPPNESAAFFLALREFLQRPDRHNSRLVLLLVSVLTPNEIVTTWETGGISIGFFRDLPLPFFTDSPEVRNQLVAQGFPDRNPGVMDGVVSEVLQLTGGQPFLTALACQELQFSTDPKDALQQLQQDLLRAPRSIAQNHLFGVRKQLMDMGDRLFGILQLFRRVVRGERITRGQGGWDAASLENIGLLRLGDDDRYRIANPIYQARFDDAWVQELMKDRETHSLPKQFHTGQRLFSRRIALIFCGGTAGMITRDGHSTFQGAREILLDFARQELDRIAEVESHPLYELDGINMMPEQWRGVADFIHEWWDHYDGFVVAHGTDTLAYTASAVAFMLGRVGKPVVFTGAQTTIDVPHGDTRHNLIRACYAAAHPQAVPETQVCFNDLVLRAVRTEKADDRLFHGFHSPGWPPLARVTENFLPDYRVWLEGGAPLRLDYRPHIAPDILLITLAPGLRPAPFQSLLEHAATAGHPYHGLIITTPGLGNIPSEEPYNFRPLIQDAVAADIPVLISSQVPINPYTQEQYEMASVPARYGAIPAGNLTVAAALTKFAWVIGNVDREEEPGNRLERIKARMRHNFIGEEGEYAGQAY